MKALGLAWRREIPTERFEPTAAFYRDVMGLEEERWGRISRYYACRWRSLDRSARDRSS
jgi:predicted enzyme related to lactoylglutathione lyase